MRGFKAFAFAATATVLLAGSLQAQGTLGSVKWHWFNTNTAPHSLYNNTNSDVGARDIFRSPYFAQFDMTNNFNFVGAPVADIFCVDYLNSANTSSHGYSAYFTNLGTNAGDIGTYTRNGSRRNIQSYLQAAWLASEMVNPTGNWDTETGTRSEKQLRGMQAAMWYVMSGSPRYFQYEKSDGTTTWGGSTPIGNWLAAATTGVAQWTTAQKSQWVVVTDTAAAGHELGGSQEYITQVTPEPATMLLLGTGLVVMLMAAGALRRPVA